MKGCLKEGLAGAESAVFLGGFCGLRGYSLMGRRTPRALISEDYYTRWVFDEH